MIKTAFNPLLSYVLIAVLTALVLIYVLHVFQVQNARQTGRVGSKVAARIKRTYGKTKGKAVKVAEVVEKPQGIIKGGVADLSRSVKIRAAAAVTVESAVPVREGRTTGNPQYHNRQENQFRGNAAGNPDQDPDNFHSDRVMRGVENGHRLSWNLGEIVDCVLASHEFVNNEVELSQAPIGNYHASIVRLRAGRDYTDGNVCHLCM